MNPEGGGILAEMPSKTPGGKAWRGSRSEETVAWAVVLRA